MTTPAQQLANYAQTTLASAALAGDTTLTVVSAAGFPTAGNFMLRVDDPAPATTFEYVECTGVSGNVLTVTRGQEGTTGIAHVAGAFVGNDLTAAMLLRSFDIGVFTNGYAQVVANQGSITTNVDLTSLAVTVTVPAGRRIRIIGQVSAFSSTVSGDSVSMFIQEGATVLQQMNTSSVNPVNPGVSMQVVVSPSTGSHTYKLTVTRSGGTGTVTMNAGANSPAFILVEDLGPA